MASIPAAAGRTLPREPFLYAIIDASLRGERSLTSWAELLSGPLGAAVVQWRFKGLSDAVALDGARELREATRRTGALLVINDRPDIARMVDADGVHLGQDDMAPSDARTLLPGCLLGVSTHNRGQFEAALASPADYIAVGPVFETSSKANPEPVVGLEFVAWAKKVSDRPIVGIGGIDASNAESLVRAGARGAAVISGLMKAEDPALAARLLREAILGRDNIPQA